MMLLQPLTSSTIVGLLSSLTCHPCHIEFAKPISRLYVLYIWLWNLDQAGHRVL
jgi:hypothetical protein